VLTIGRLVPRSQGAIAPLRESEYSLEAFIVSQVSTRTRTVAMRVIVKTNATGFKAHMEPNEAVGSD
jgi:hypothetical protein